jgi:hypothetical protein
LSVAPHNLSDQDLHQYKVVETIVQGVEGIRSWPKEEDQFLKSNAVDAETANRMRSEPASEFPQLRAHFQQVLTARFKNELSYLTRPIFSGSRPAQLVVRLRVFDVPSATRRVFVDSSAKIQADIDLVDKASGRLILRYNGRLETKKLIGGLATGIAVAFEQSDVGQSMIVDYLSAYRNWLLRN